MSRFARLAQTPPSDYRPAGMTDCMIECPACGIEWGWGGQVAGLKVMIAKHNHQVHRATATDEEKR